jgi:His-Xaa-Ser system radical SAM maturase HxsB
MASPAPSRLTQLPDAGRIKLAEDSVGALAYRRVGDRYLVTSDVGHHADLSAEDFTAYLEGRIDKAAPLWAELQSKDLIRDHLDFPRMIENYRRRFSFLYAAAPLHIVVATLRCNHKCMYCHSSVVGLEQTDKDMTLETARKTVDFIFQSPSPSIIIEFQGGEPTLNMPVIKFITRYAKLKNQRQAVPRSLFITMVSNFSLLNDEIFDFILKEKIGICTSLDGPAELHNKNRIFTGGSSHELTVEWLRRFQAAATAAEGEDRARYFQPGALLTTTRFSLEHPREIIDEYLRLGLPGLFVRQISPIGFARRSWKQIGYSTDEFLAFYRKMLDRIIDVNLSGTPFFERAALVALTKILRQREPGYVDLRSPSGAALGVLAYDYNGDVYTGDEARMLAAEGDRFFRVGHVSRSYNESIDHPVTRAAASATLLENQPLCAQCAYKPYCGLDAVYNRQTQRSLWGHMPANERCRLYMGLFDIVFEKLRDPRVRGVFESWLDKWSPEEAVPGPEPVTPK